MIVNFSNLIDVLKSDKIAVIPTDTIYGLVACAKSSLAVKKVYFAKKRNPAKPCIILIDCPEIIVEFGINSKWLDLTSKYWPGPFSLIFPTERSDLGYLDCGTKTLAFRMPDNKDLLSLIARTGPIIAPSANPEGLPPAQNINQAKKYFETEVDMYIDGGLINNYAPSTIIDMRDQSKIR